MAKSGIPDDELKDAAADIVARGQRVRERVRDLLVQVLQGRMVSPGAMQNVVQEVMGGAIEALEDAVPSDRSSTLRQVMTGIGDGFAAIGAASRRASKSVAAHGKELQEDMVPLLQRATSDASRQVLSAMSRFSRRLSGSMRDEIETLVAEARRTGLDIAPVAKRTARVAAQDPVGLAAETMSTGLRLAGSTAAHLISATGGVLAGIGEAVASVSSRPEERSAGAKSSKSSSKTSSKSSSKKSASKSSSRSGSASRGEKSAAKRPKSGAATAGKSASSKKAGTSGKSGASTSASGTRSKKGASTGGATKKAGSRASGGARTKASASGTKKGTSSGRAGRSGATSRGAKGTARSTSKTSKTRSKSGRSRSGSGSRSS